jgi:hypothetical protein
MELDASFAQGQGFRPLCDSGDNIRDDQTITGAIGDNKFPGSWDQLDNALDTVFNVSEETSNTSSDAQTDYVTSTQHDHDQICSDLAYEHVLKEFGLPPGAKLHESSAEAKAEERIRTFQKQFNLLSGRTKAQSSQGTMDVAA